MNNSFYSVQELQELGLRRVGKCVRISRKASLYTPEKISIGDHVRIDDFCILSGMIHLGVHVHISAFCALYGSNGITLEDFSGLSTRVTIFSATDDYSGKRLTNPTCPSKYRGVITGPVVIHRHAIIGAGAVIMPKIVIGKGAGVGAMSLVTKNVPPWTIAFGIPARHLRSRQKNILALETALLNEEKNAVRTSCKKFLKK